MNVDISGRCSPSHQASKSCCHQEAIYSSPSRHPAYSVSFLGEHRRTAAHSTAILTLLTNVCVCACEYACHCAHTLPHTDLHKQNNCGLPVVSHFLELYQNPIVQQHYKATASPDWGLIYVLGSPESAGLSSNLPLIVHQCHSEWMGPLISVRGSGGKQYHASSAFSDNMQKKKKVSLCFHGFQEQSGCKENPYCTQQRQGAGP